MQDMSMNRSAAVPCRKQGSQHGKLCGRRPKLLLNYRWQQHHMQPPLQVWFPCKPPCRLAFSLSQAFNKNPIACILGLWRIALSWMTVRHCAMVYWHTCDAWGLHLPLLPKEVITPREKWIYPLEQRTREISTEVNIVGTADWGETEPQEAATSHQSHQVHTTQMSNGLFSQTIATCCSIICGLSIHQLAVWLLHGSVWFLWSKRFPLCLSTQCSTT